MANRQQKQLLLLAILSTGLVHLKDWGSPGLGVFCGIQQSRRLLPTAGAWPLGRSKMSGVAPTQNMSTMDTNEVADWVVSLASPLRPYGKVFRDNAVDGKLLMELTDDDLQEMGVEQTMHRRHILVRRDELLADGFNETLRGQWQLESAFDIQPELMKLQPQRFASHVLARARAPQRIRPAAKQMDCLLCDQHNAVIQIETLEAMNHLMSHRTAHVAGGSSRVSEEIRSDLQMVVHAKTAARERMVVTMGKNLQLATAIRTFCQSCRNVPSDANMERARATLATIFEQWKDVMLQVAEAASFHNEALLQRTSARFQSQIPGGAAVQASIQALSEVTQELQQAAEKCKRIQNRMCSLLFKLEQVDWLTPSRWKLPCV